MRFNKEDRIQNETYDTLLSLFEDIISTINDESNFEHIVNIVTDTQLTETLIEYILHNSTEEFEFDIQVVDLRDNVDTYTITILDNGEVYVEPTIDKNGEYHDLDGFIFTDKYIDEEVYKGNNRNCDVIVFDLNS